MREPVILGIDPGSQRTGWAVLAGAGPCAHLVAAGVIDVARLGSLPRRCARIWYDLSQIIAEYAPDIIGIETIYPGRNRAAALVLAAGRGAALAAIGCDSARLVECTPAQAKVCVAGHPRAGKGAVRAAVKKLYGLPQLPRPDEADAIAIATWVYITGGKHK